MENKDQQASPGYGLWANKEANENHWRPGLSKREWFAGMALQGFCSWDHNEGRMMYTHTTRVEESIRVADALLKELEKDDKS